MSRTFLIIALVLAASASAFSQSSGASLAELRRENSVRVDSIPISDNLAVQKSETAQSRSKAGAHRMPDSVNEREETEGRFWGSAEYLLWKMKRSNLPPLITTGTANSDAIIGHPGTVIAFGGNQLDRGRFPGGRFTAGMWLNEKRNVGVELSYFFLKERTFRFQISSNGQPGSPIIARPFFDPLFQPGIGRIQGESVIYVGLQGGSSTATSPSHLRGVEANLIYQLKRTFCCRVGLRTGFSYLDLNESLDITDTSQFPSVSTVRTDQFSTSNQFYGGHLGLHSSFKLHRLNLELDGKAAIGNNRENVEIDGRVSDPNNLRGGYLLALTSNIGQYRRREFTVVPEMKTQVVYRFNNRWRAFVGYDFLYWNKVVRPGDQIDRVVNLYIQITGRINPPPAGPLRPIFTFRDSRFWAQGLNIGIQTRF